MACVMEGLWTSPRALSVARSVQAGGLLMRISANLFYFWNLTKNIAPNQNPYAFPAPVLGVNSAHEDATPLGRDKQNSYRFREIP